MRSTRSTLRNVLAGAALAALSLNGIGTAIAQAPTGGAAVSTGDHQTSATGLDLYHLPAIPKFAPPKTAWGDPDFRGHWPIDSLGGLPLQRTAAQGNRVFLNDDEYAASEKRMAASRTAAERETKANKLGMGNWVEMTGAGRRTSLLVDPANGRLPELTAYGKETNAAGRSSWVRGQTYDWVTDFDSWDRCISRGFPASMMAFRYNNGIQIFQSPGYVVIYLEMLGTRVIPIGKPGHWPKPVTAWLGDSVGHWEGNTLVVETTNIKVGASPINMATIGSPPNNTIPMGADAKVTERFTLANKDTLVYEMTLNDPKVWTAPWSIREDWQRNEAYGMFEYACHEGDVQVRNYINASRVSRQKDMDAAEAKKTADAAAAQAAAAAAAAPADTAKKKKK